MEKNISKTQPQGLTQFSPLKVYNSLKAELAAFSTEDLIAGQHRKNAALAVKTIDWQQSVTLAEVHTYPRVFQGTAAENLHTAIAFIALFNAAMSVSERMDAMEIYDTATWYLKTYTHDSIVDLLLCLRMAKEGKLGKNYNRLDMITIAEYVIKYMELKYGTLEAEHYSKKSQYGDFRTEQDKILAVQRTKEYQDRTARLETQTSERLATAKKVYEETKQKMKWKS